MEWNAQGVKNTRSGGYKKGSSQEVENKKRLQYTSVEAAGSLG